MSQDELTRREMYAEIKRLCAPDNVTNWFTILSEYAVLAIAIAGCLAWYRYVTDAGWSLWWAAPVYALAVIVVGAWVQNRLSVLVHEASHYSLFKNRVLNDLAANLLLLFPVFGTIQNYRVIHWAHHRHVNDPATDPDLQRLERHHPRRFPIRRWRFLWEYVILQLLPHKALSYLKGRALYVAVPMRSEPARNYKVLPWQVVELLRASYYLPMFTLLTVYGWWPHYLLLWVVPFLTCYPCVLFLREIAHHGNYPDDGDFTNSRYYKAGWLERQVFFPFGEHNHVLHHMFPTIPHHKMDEAHEVMLRYPPYRDTVVTCNGFFVRAEKDSDEPTVLEILAKPADAYLRARDREPLRGQIRRATIAEVGHVER